jgi:hypothetical protein
MKFTDPCSAARASFWNEPHHEPDLHTKYRLSSLAAFCGADLAAHQPLIDSRRVVGHIRQWHAAVKKALGIEKPTAVSNETLMVK